MYGAVYPGLTKRAKEKQVAGAISGLGARYSPSMATAAWDEPGPNVTGDSERSSRKGQKGFARGIFGNPRGRPRGGSNKIQSLKRHGNARMGDAQRPAGLKGQAERYRPFTAHLHAHGMRLGETNLVCVAGFSITDQARLRGDEFEMWFIAKAPRGANRNDGVADGRGT